MSSRAAAGRKRLQTPPDSLSASKTSGRTVPTIYPSPETHAQQDVDIRAGYKQLPPYSGYQLSPAQDSPPKFKKSVGQSPQLLPTVNQAFSRTPPISASSNVFQNTIPPGSYDNFNRCPPSPQLLVSATPVRPRTLPIPQSYQVQQDPYFVGYSSPASHSTDSISMSNIPYREMSNSADHSLSSSLSGTPTATSFTSFHSEHTVNTVYTSPPASHIHLTSSPTSATATTSPSSATATIDNATLYQYRRDSADSDSPSSSKDSQASMNMDHRQYYASSSSSGSQRGASSASSDSSFVFPSSRSRAVPSSPPRFRFKKRKGKERVVAEPQPIPAGPSILARGETHPSFPGTSISFVEPPPKVTSPASSARSSTQTTSSEGSQGFVFPSSRSRAHPDPSKKMKSPKASPPTDVSPTSPSRFMGITIKRKKKSNGIAPTIREEPTEPSPSHYPDPDPTYLDELQSRLGSDENRTTAVQRSTKVGTYPLDPYDSTLLEWYVPSLSYMKRDSRLLICCFLSTNNIFSQ